VTYDRQLRTDQEHGSELSGQTWPGDFRLEYLWRRPDGRNILKLELGRESTCESALDSVPSTKRSNTSLIAVPTVCNNEYSSR